MATNEAEAKATDPAQSTARYQLREMLTLKAPEKVGAFDMRALNEFDALVFVCFQVLMKPPADPPSEVDATDAARALAEANNVDLTEVEGTGVNGRVIVDDVQLFIAERDSA